MVVEPGVVMIDQTVWVIESVHGNGVYTAHMPKDISVEGFL